MKGGEATDSAGKTAFQCARAGAAAGILVTAGLLALPLDAAVDRQEADRSTALPVFDRNFRDVVAANDQDTLEAAREALERRPVLVAQNAPMDSPPAEPPAQSKPVDETANGAHHEDPQTTWRARELGLMDRIQDWLARANREFQTVIIRRLSVAPPGGGGDDIARKLEDVKEEDVEASRRRAQEAIEAVQATQAEEAKHRQELADAAKRKADEAKERQQEESRAAALADEQRQQRVLLEAEAKRAEEQQRLAEQKRADEARLAAQVQQQAIDKQKADDAAAREAAEQQHQRDLAAAAEKAAEDAKQKAADEEAARIAAAKEADERAQQAARDAAEKQRVAEEEAARVAAAKAQEKAQQEAAERDAAEKQRLAQAEAAKAAEAKAQQEAAARDADEKRRLADGAAARDAAAKAAEEKARQEAAAKQAAEQQRIAEENAKSAAAKAVVPAPHEDRKEPSASSHNHQAQLVREASAHAAPHAHIAHGPVVKRRVRRARQGRCRYSGYKILLPGRYVVARGDTLWRIALRHYRSGLYYMRIYRANRDLIRNPNLIYPCERLQLPRSRG
jgi:nucleoid-associated protein YgaU